MALPAHLKLIRGGEAKELRAITSFLASFSGRPQQLRLLFNQKNTGNVSDPVGGSIFDLD
jgi:hypothetical protein